MNKNVYGADMSAHFDNMENEILSVCGVKYRLIRLLGKGKGGYSYLAIRAEQEYDAATNTHGPDMGGNHTVVLKQIHHEKCEYYTFGNKIEAEKRDYATLCGAGIRMPRMIAIDEENERIVKEYIHGRTVAELVEKDGKIDPRILAQGQKMADLARAAGLNIDYYPTNFVTDEEGVLYYVDYECNRFMEEWSFENWGIKYWMPNG